MSITAIFPLYLLHMEIINLGKLIFVHMACKLSTMTIRTYLAGTLCGSTEYMCSISSHFSWRRSLGVAATNEVLFDRHNE